MATTGYGTPYVAGTDLVANWPAASLTVANAIDATGYFAGRGNNTQIASYTTVLTDAGKTVTMSNASASTVTIPANSSVAYVIGTLIRIVNLGVGATTPTAGVGVTIAGTITALATNQGAAVLKTGTNTWSYLPFTSGTAALTAADVSSTTGSPTITTSSIYTIYKFTGSGTMTLGKEGTCDVLIGGGGGGGGSSASGFGGSGAGGGGGVSDQKLLAPAGVWTVTIGAGGAADATGAASKFTNGNTKIVGMGGGDGGVSDAATAADATGAYGGSGGGGGNTSGAAGSAGTGVQGGNGGIGATDGSSFRGGGGGGGASSTGSAATTSVGGAGGSGLTSSITGVSTVYGGGGGGGSSASGGTGGGGTAGGASRDGVANTAGGGAGRNGSTYPAGLGGSGVVIIRVLT